jgi:hypothetical protein
MEEEKEKSVDCNNQIDMGGRVVKAARPTIAYGGFAIILWVYVILPTVAFFLGQDYPEIDLPSEFWYTWGGIITAWTIGRTFEKRGLKGPPR